MKNIGKCVVYITLSIFLLHMIMLCRIEIMTYKHSNEFENIQNSMISNIEYLKVLTYKEDYAKIYYICKDKSSGHIIEFKKNEDNIWTEKSWDTIWAKSGSASEILWMYWWDTIIHACM